MKVINKTKIGVEHIVLDFGHIVLEVTHMTNIKLEVARKRLMASKMWQHKKFEVLHKLKGRHKSKGRHKIMVPHKIIVAHIRIKVQCKSFIGGHTKFKEPHMM
jgi:hypothetical protein